MFLSENPNLLQTDESVQARLPAAAGRLSVPRGQFPSLYLDAARPGEGGCSDKVCVTLLFIGGKSPVWGSVYTVVMTSLLLSHAVVETWTCSPRPIRIVFFVSDPSRA